MVAADPGADPDERDVRADHRGHHRDGQPHRAAPRAWRGDGPAGRVHPARARDRQPGGRLRDRPLQPGMGIRRRGRRRPADRVHRPDLAADVGARCGARRVLVERFIN